MQNFFKFEFSFDWLITDVYECEKNIVYNKCVLFSIDKVIISEMNASIQKQTCLKF